MAVRFVNGTNRLLIDMVVLIGKEVDESVGAIKIEVAFI
jgi:hypothetical protein